MIILRKIFQRIYFFVTFTYFFFRFETSSTNPCVSYSFPRLEDEWVTRLMLISARKVELFEPFFCSKSNSLRTGNKLRSFKNLRIHELQNLNNGTTRASKNFLATSFSFPTKLTSIFASNMLSLARSRRSICWIPTSTSAKEVENKFYHYRSHLYY